ncbi:hypothetical protein KVT40_004129 [Elsinoe batatas]|uniref:Nucleotide-diphospho-sugar transferase domain-containing protein n=1 Tax=Elsinoe batatas TaxID=2601811 RepID=A0A8K0L1P0_9PEZI|nr:hypothetical protein KVT40_004129 [Elsinoe batatas]
MMKGMYEPLDVAHKKTFTPDNDEPSAFVDDEMLKNASRRVKSQQRNLHGYGSILDRIDRRAKVLLGRLSTWSKLAIFVPMLLSAVLSPLLLIMQNARLTALSSDIPAMLKQMPWNPSMLPPYPVLDQFRERADFSSSRFPTPLGGKVVLLDVDTRPWSIPDASNMTQISYGRANHWLYAKMHGYDYKYVQAPELPGDIRQTWVKVDAIRNVLLEGYQFIVFTDYDIVFPHLKIPIEWFLDFWNVTPEIILTVGSVPNRTDKYDQFHRHLSINTGFMIIQNAPRALDMLKDWAECPSEVKYPGCAQWKIKLSNEQNAYADYVRYTYPNTTRDIECDQVTSSEFMTMPRAKKCRGTLIQHFWAKKDEVKNAVQASIANLIFPEVIREMKDTVVPHIE